MVRLALQGESGLCVDAREVARPRPAYTIETLEEVRAELGPTAELWFLIGGDSLTQLHTGTAGMNCSTAPTWRWRCVPASVWTSCPRRCAKNGTPAKSLIFQNVRLPVQSAPGIDTGRDVRHRHPATAGARAGCQR
ncbi:nicotinate-nicotinamide nucleotide adenylyltransferase [Paludibacterium denitrificans]|uniref:nicotinate-nicotinamide nucleotide adenylyltransferase n=1 Tax=Paludibacterium denitrificans TaxID=2675226 RepID=UPI0024782DF0|nr:hypothetical protein [Paludibacterium denitrificans]